jgi:hypothetical protein
MLVDWDPHMRPFSPAVKVTTLEKAEKRTQLQDENERNDQKNIKSVHEPIQWFHSIQHSSYVDKFGL